MLIREGGIIPLNVEHQHFSHPGEQRGFMVAPYRGVGVVQGECFEEDGEPEAWTRLIPDLPAPRDAG